MQKRLVKPWASRCSTRCGPHVDPSGRCRKKDFNLHIAFGWITARDFRRRQRRDWLKAFYARFVYKTAPTKL